MVNSYHKSIENAIIKFGGNHKLVKKVFRGNSHPIPIADSISKKMINYKPDVYFLLKNRYKIIFQVLGSELKKQDAIIADVVRGCLVENCKGMIFIHSSEKEADNNRVLEALHTIVRGLTKKNMPIDELPENNGSYSITKKIAKNENKVILILSKKSKEDGWFK